MSAKAGRWIVVLACALALFASSALGLAAAAPGNASDGAEFTLTVSSAYARSEPDAASPAVFSIFQGNTLAVQDRSPDGRWLLVSGWQMTGWVPANAGVLTEPDLPRQSGQPSATAIAAIRPVPAGVVPEISDRAREIYLHGLSLGNQPGVFAKVGDCNTENGRFLAMFDQPGVYRLGTQYAFLQRTIDNFAGWFEHSSVAAHSGFSPAAVLSPVWADPTLCEPGESPLQCEYRRLRPSVAIVNLGTHPGPNRAEFEATLRLVLDESIRLGVLPILATKADDAEGGGWVNDTVRDLAAEYELPLWDFWKASQPLPGHGLAYTGIHPTYGRSYFDDPWAMTRGWTWRNLTALLALDAVLDGTQDLLPPSPRANPDLRWR